MKKKPGKSEVFETPSKRHVTAKIQPAEVKKITGQEEKKEPIAAKNAAIAKEKKKSIKQTGVKPGKTVFETTTYTEQDISIYAFITLAVKEHFKLTDALFKEWLTRWDFPKSIGDVHKKHKVFRHYCQPSVNLLIDVFDGKVSFNEINRIKAHLEALGYRYTYFKGGDVYANKEGFMMESFKKLLFVDRLKPVDVKTLKEPVKVPTSLEQAGINQVVVQG